MLELEVDGTLSDSIRTIPFILEYTPGSGFLKTTELSVVFDALASSKPAEGRNAAIQQDGVSSGPLVGKGSSA